MNRDYRPTPDDKFSFGLWTVGNPGRDPFGAPTRSSMPPHRLVRLLGEEGAYGVNFHDNDLIPIDATPRERARILKDFRQALADYNVCVPMATTNLFSEPVFKDGAFTSHDPDVRAFALQKTMRAIDLGVELGARVYVFWGGREGAEVDAAKDAAESIKRFRECLNFLIGYVKENGYDLKFALEAKPNEPRGDIYFATTGSMLAFTYTVDDPDMVGVNPELAHEHMAGLNFYHAVAQAWEAGKLFHIDLNDQKPNRFDQDLRFGSEGLKAAFFLVKFLEEVGYSGPRHFDAHAYRTEDEAGVRDFRRRMHAHLPDPEGEGAALRRRSGDPGDPGGTPGKRLSGSRCGDAEIHAGNRASDPEAPNWTVTGWHEEACVTNAWTNSRWTCCWESADRRTQ